MAYHLEISGPVMDYLRHFAGLSREGRIKLFANFIRDLRDYGDQFRADPSRRLSPGSPLFWYSIAFLDGQRGYEFRFLVDDSPAAYGVLRIRFVDAEAGEAL